jgi:transcriptional regulator with XRE-family HTH domain
MTTLSELLSSTSPTQRRATALADADYRLLGDLIQLRKERDLTQQQVADALGISQPAVAAFERHDADPKLSTIRRYAHAIGALVTHAVSGDDSWADRDASQARGNLCGSGMKVRMVIAAQEGHSDTGLAAAHEERLPLFCVTFPRDLATDLRSDFATAV